MRRSKRSLRRPRSASEIKAPAQQPPPRSSAPPAPAEPEPGSNMVVVRDTTDLVSRKLSDFSHVTWEWQDIKEFTVQRIQEIISRLQLPPEDLTSPRPDISIPAIEAMRYSPLKHEIAYLIAATMDKTRVDETHPSYIEIIKQLTADEICLLSAFPDSENVIPLLNINYVDKGDRIKSSIRFIIPKAMADVCERKSSVPKYIDNLLRLKLLDMPSGLKITDRGYYRRLLNQPFLKNYQSLGASQLRPLLDRRVVRLTNFGSSFRDCCIDREHLPAITQ